MDATSKWESFTFTVEEWKLMKEALEYTSRHLPFYTVEQQNKVFEIENVISRLTFAFLSRGILQEDDIGRTERKA